MCGCSCGSCLDPLVLPVGPTGPQGIQGVTGATGPAGAAGAAGSSTIVLHNDKARSTTTSATLALFSATKAYTITSGTLSDDDVVEISVVLNTTSFTPFNTFGWDIYFNGGSYTSVTIPKQIYAQMTDNQHYVKIDLQVSREDATTLFITSDVYFCEAGSGVTFEHFHWDERSFAVADLDLNNLAIDVRGKTDIGNLHCDQLLVKHLKV